MRLLLIRCWLLIDWTIRTTSAGAKYLRRGATLIKPVLFRAASVAKVLCKVSSLCVAFKSWPRGVGNLGNVGGSSGKECKCHRTASRRKRRRLFCWAARSMMINNAIVLARALLAVALHQPADSLRRSVSSCVDLFGPPLCPCPTEMHDGQPVGDAQQCQAANT